LYSLCLPVFYKALENKLKELCGELGIELSLLDRILFGFKSEIDAMLEKKILALSVSFLASTKNV